nr:MAG TPA: hypothetical protein [Caudoviricetes sp.]
MKNVVAMNSNNYTQEGQVEGQVNDQVANDQNVGSQKGDQKKGGFNGKYKERIRVENKQLELRENPNDKEPKFKAKIPGRNSQYIRACFHHNGYDDEISKVNSDDDLQKLVDKAVAKRRDKKKPNKYSKKSVDELLLDLADILEALEEKKDKSPEEWCKDAQEVVDKRELEEADKDVEELAEALEKAKARREALQAKQSNQ